MDTLLQARTKELFFYSPYNFIRVIDQQKQIQNIVIPTLIGNNNTETSISLQGKQHLFFHEYLAWDTAFFNLPTYKLKTVLFNHQDVSILALAVKEFVTSTIPEGAYLFIEIPSEDILLIQALGSAGFKLVETRLNYFRGNLENFNEPRYPVKRATIADTDNLKRVAREMRNDYDRFHADTTFNVELADEFLSKYIEESLKGFADVVLTPNEPTIPSDSFLTAKFFKNEWDLLGKNVSKMVLSAVSNKTNKGWYAKLISEMTYLLREEGAEFIHLNTQSTNRAVFYTWEKLGYRLGSSTHVLSLTNNK